MSLLNMCNQSDEGEKPKLAAWYGINKKQIQRAYTTCGLIKETLLNQMTLMLNGSLQSSYQRHLDDW